MGEETFTQVMVEHEQQEYHVNMGPQHPSTHGVLRLLLSLKGETVADIKPYVGYVHRGIEKIAESDSYQQIIHLLDRIDYLSAHTNNEALCLLVEKALQIEVSDRVKYIRTIIAELNRIASHQLWWSAMGMDLGALTTFFYGLRDREKILDIFEATTGGRLLQSYNIPGGLMNDIHTDFIKDVKDFIVYFKKKLPEYDQLLTGNVIFQSRTKGVGFLSKADAISYGVTGPSGRGSGFKCDLRIHQPYSAYDKVQFKEILSNEGDTFARYECRMLEMWESMSIIEQLIDNIPDGPIAVKMKPVIKLPKGEYFQRVETARGELGIYVVSDEAKTPYRFRIRTPNFSNLSALSEMAKGSKIADLVAIMASLDLVIPDIDR